MPPPAARTLLHEADDQIEEVTLGQTSIDAVRDREPSRLERLQERLAARLPEPVGDEADEIAYAEVGARWLAARRSGEALEIFEHLPGIDAATVEAVKETFAHREQEAGEAVAELDRREDAAGRELRLRQAKAIGRGDAADELRELSEVGLLSEAMVSRVAQEVAEEVSGPPDKQ